MRVLGVRGKEYYRKRTRSKSGRKVEFRECSNWIRETGVKAAMRQHDDRAHGGRKETENRRIDLTKCDIHFSLSRALQGLPLGDSRKNNKDRIMLSLTDITLTETVLIYTHIHTRAYDNKKRTVNLVKIKKRFVLSHLVHHITCSIKICGIYRIDFQWQQMTYNFLLFEKRRHGIHALLNNSTARFRDPCGTLLPQ